MTSQELLEVLESIKDDCYPHPTNYNIPKNVFNIQCYSAWAIEYLIEWVGNALPWLSVDDLLNGFREEMNNFVCKSKTDEQKILFISALDVVDDVIDAVVDEEIRKERSSK